MEQESQQPTQNSSKSMLLASISQSTTARSLEKKDFRSIERSVKNNPKEILDRPNIAMLQKVVDPVLPELFLARQLEKLVESVNLDARLNMRPEQITELAEDLVDTFPVETLEDFVLCFRRATMGMYGIIYKIDKSVVFTWMATYLGDKYMYVEHVHQSAKEEGAKQDEINYEAFKKRMANERESTWVSEVDLDEFKRRMDSMMKINRGK